MTELSQQQSDRGLKTPRAAAISGILFGIFSITTFTIFSLYVPPLEDQDSDTWLALHVNAIRLALTLIPFAGIAFLWFMGVARDRLGLLEDRFFSTLFFGSGLLYLGLVFITGSMSGGLLTAYAFDPDILTQGNTYLFARAIMLHINNVYTIRMAGMFMTVQATIWMRTQVMPRWTALITYVLALILLFGINITRWLTIVFPVWVLLVSVYLLILTYHVEKDAEGSSAAEPSS